MENKLKHLEFIQNTITRMAQNSFLLKGWSITIVSAIFVLSEIDSKKEFIYIAYIPVMIFWLLDSYYLFQERLFRKLYATVSTLNESDINFLMVTDDEAKKFKISWLKTFFSKTILIFHLSILIVIIVSTLLV